jgi:GT2 family glycosyltransferase
MSPWVTTAAMAAGPNEVRFGVVVVNWRNAPDTLECLDSLLAARSRPDRVVVLDNGSGDCSVERVVEWAQRHAVCHELRAAREVLSLPGDAAAPQRTPGKPWLTIIDGGANLGFAGGNNFGISLLRREQQLTHFLLLNNDASVAPEYFDEMRVVLERWPRAGLCIGTIYEEGQRDRVWYAGGRIIPSRALVKHELRLPSSSEPVRTEFVTGCAMVIARAALDRAGLLAECYFPGYMEDAEYSWRVRKAGLDLVYAPRPVVYHKVGSTFGARNVSSLAAYHQNRHRLYFVRRNLRGHQRLAALLYMAATKPGRALIDAIEGRPRIGWAVLRGTIDGLVKQLPTA